MLVETEQKFKFRLLHRSKRSKARVGQIITPHGSVYTPNFVAVGTNGAIKAVDVGLVEKLYLPLIFCNTYHLLVQPGIEVIKRAGGLHAFMGYQAPIITDSGGFQVFSLKYGGVAKELKSNGARMKTGSCVVKLTEDGVLFRSYRDGSPIFLSPESSIAAQKEFRADIIVAFDELLPYHIDKKYQQQAFDRTHRWQERSLSAHMARPDGQALYAVVHGDIDENLRRRSATFLGALPFDGFGIGGSVGKDREEMNWMLSLLMPHLPENKPVHLLGIGDPLSIEMAIRHGIDTFDSAHPTKTARHGLLLTSNGPVKVSQSGSHIRFSPADPNCYCYTCRHHTVAYLHHLFKAGELSFFTLATIHNLTFMVELLSAYRRKILEDKI